MPCDTRLKPRQSIKDRQSEVKKAVEKLDAKLKSGQAKAKVDTATGAIAFSGLTEFERDGITDACAYRRLMVEGSSEARAAIAKAEAMSGRTVSKEALAQGVHSHDGGTTWGKH